MKYFKIKEGDLFLCKKKVVMLSSKEVAYRKGTIYISEKDGCITNEQEEENHRWTDINEFKKHFVKIDRNQKVFNVIRK